jgi:hypothetical protein
VHAAGMRSKLGQHAHSQALSQLQHELPRP